MTDELTVFAMIVTSIGCDVAALQALAQKPSFMMTRVDNVGKRTRTRESDGELMLDHTMVVPGDKGCGASHAQLEGRASRDGPPLSLDR